MSFEASPTRDVTGRDPLVEIAQRSPQPFYQRLRKRLVEYGFDSFVEDLCRELYLEDRGETALKPGLYFRMRLIGYFEEVGAELG